MIKGRMLCLKILILLCVTRAYNPFQHDTILDQSKFKEGAEDNSKLMKSLKSWSIWTENIVDNEEIAYETRKPNETTLRLADDGDAPVEKAGEVMVDDDMAQDPDATNNVTDGSMGIFHKKVFVILGFNDEIILETSGVIAEQGGMVLEQNSRKIPDFAIVPLYGYPVDRTVGDVVTNIWLDMCLEQNSFLDVHSNPLFSPVEIHEDASPLKDCVLSISGYAGTEREALMHIAEDLGAVNQECFLPVAKNGLLASTQIIVDTPSGSKYKAAKEWGIPAVSKSWLLASAQSGKLEPVENYLIDNETENINQENQLTKDAHVLKDSSKETECVTKDQIKPSKDATDGNKSLSKTSKPQSESITNVSKSDENNTEDGVKANNETLITNQMDANNSNVNKPSGADFSATGDTEAIFLAMNSQNRPDLTARELNRDIQNKCNAGASYINNIPLSVQSEAQNRPYSVQNSAQTLDKRSEVVHIDSREEDVLQQMQNLQMMGKKELKEEMMNYLQPKS